MVSCALHFLLPPALSPKDALHPTIPHEAAVGFPIIPPCPNTALYPELSAGMVVISQIA